MRTDTLQTEADVRNFFQYLLWGLKVNFHPDTPFEDYVAYGTDESTFTSDQVILLNGLMAQSFDVLGDRIYDVADEEFRRVLTT